MADPINYARILVCASHLDKNAGTKMGIRVGAVDTKVQTGMFNFMDNDRHTASIGFKFTVPKAWRLGASS